MNIPTLEQRSRLPNWAIHYIKFLEMRLSEAKADLAVLHGDKPTAISYGDEHTGGVGYVPGRSVRFTSINPNWEIEVSMRHDFAAGISVMGNRGSLIIIPNVSNVVRIQEVQR